MEAVSESPEHESPSMRPAHIGAPSSIVQVSLGSPVVVSDAIAKRAAHRAMLSRTDLAFEEGSPHIEGGPAPPTELTRTHSAEVAVPLDPDARVRLMVERQREEKWLEMVRDWPKWKDSRAARVKERCRKGIPDSIRAVAWPLLLDVEGLRAKEPELLTEFLGGAVEPSRAASEQIELDLGRTFPKEDLFKGKRSIGQQSLRRVLRAYAAKDEEVGYCQGMGFPAALMLSYCPEEDTFLMFHALMQHRPYRLRTLYLPGFQAVQLSIFQLDMLLKRLVPKAHRHLASLDIHPALWSTQWLLTCFCYSLPFHLAARVWDSMLFEGFKVVLRVAVAIVKRMEARILLSDFEGTLMLFRAISTSNEAHVGSVTTVTEPSSSSASSSSAAVPLTVDGSSELRKSMSDRGARRSRLLRTKEAASLSIREWCELVLDADELMNEAFSLSISRRQLEAYAVEYAKTLKTAATSGVPEHPG
jgi:TBC1 domain family member 10